MPLISFSVFLQVLALFAGQPYDCKLEQLGNLDAHLTNTCSLGSEADEEQAVRLLSELPEASLCALSLQQRQKPC